MFGLLGFFLKPLTTQRPEDVTSLHIGFIIRYEEWIARNYSWTKLLRHILHCNRYYTFVVICHRDMPT